MPGVETGSPLVIVPTYCERENVEALAEAVLHACPRADLLFVDDSSPDGTGRVLDALAARRPQVHVLRRRGRAGHGRAYVTGFRWALERDYPLVVGMDADLSHDPREVPRLLEAAEAADLVIGSRYVAGARLEDWGLGRELLSRAAGLYAGVVTGLPCSDPTGGFKCYRREVLRWLDLDGITSNGFAFQVEVTHRIWRAGFRIVEVPITFRNRRAGRSKISWTIALEGAWKICSLLAEAGFSRRPSSTRPVGAAHGAAPAGAADEDRPSS